MKRSYMRRGKPLVWKGRRTETRVGKFSGRVILGKSEYFALCKKVWERDKGMCQVRENGRIQAGCLGRMLFFSTRWVDHIIKRSAGGSDSMENCRIACPICHDWADNQGGKSSGADSGVLEEPHNASTMPVDGLGVVDQG